MNTTAQPEASPAGAQPVSVPKLLAWLLFRPSRLFADLTPLKAKPMWIIVAWIAGVAFAIDRTDVVMMRSELTGRSGSSLALDSWVSFWPFILIVGAVHGMLVWLIGGWWYRVRLKWSGDPSADPFSARIVFTYTTLITAVPALLVTVIYTFVYESYRAAWNSDEAWSSLLLIFLVWEFVASYKGVRSAFAVSKWKARFWFLIMPLAFFTIFGLVIGGMYAEL
jgi:hypothetical protein